MDSALVLGGTRFIGRFLVEELREHGYAVTTLTRGNRPDPHADDSRVVHLTGDRTDRAVLERANDRVDPDLVVDMVGYHPADVQVALDVFADRRYVFVSSGAVYDEQPVPIREDETSLRPCTPEQATDEGPESYGPRKAECDRAVFAAAADGVDARSVRPVFVYGPHDYTERYAYWTHRAVTYDRVVVPGDGSSITARVFVEDVAAGIRTVAEHGEAGEAYNVADRDAMSMRRSIELAAETADREVEVVGVSERELAAGDLTPGDFPLYLPEPLVADTTKLADLGWSSTPIAEAVARTVEAHERAGRDGADQGPNRAAEEIVLEFVKEECV